MSEPKTAGELASKWLAQCHHLELLPDPDPEEVARKEAEQKLADQVEERRSKLMSAVNGRGLPLRHAQQLLFGHVEDSEALRRVADWMAKQIPGSVLVVSGGVGSGKTLAAAKAVLEGPPRDFLGRPWDAVRKPRFVDASYLHQLGLFDRDTDPIHICSVLAVDDVGTEYQDDKGVGRVILDRLVNTRYVGAGWTVITTNLSAAQFAKRYGERIMSRLKREEGCGFCTVKGSYGSRSK